MKWMSIIVLSIVIVMPGKKLLAQRLLIGTYTNTGMSKGIYVYDFDAATGKATQISVIQAGNPSYLAVNEKTNKIYGVNESDSGKISAFTFNKENGTLQAINSQKNNGSSPCYVSIDKTDKWLFSGNYGSGSLTVHPINSDGSIGAIHQFIQHYGKGVNAERQEAPHVHCTYVSPDNKFVYVPDLGLDKVFVYPFNATTGLLDTAKNSWISIKPGGGPRHIVFTKNGKFGYIIEEMSGSVNVVVRHDGEHAIIQTIHNLPEGEAAAGADIHLSPDEKFLYTSQRSNSTIQIYKVDVVSGKISYVGSQSTIGNFPRNFTIHPSGKFLLAANQKSNDIAVFKRDAKTGLLTYTNQLLKVGSPVCLVWIE